MQLPRHRRAVELPPEIYRAEEHTIRIFLDELDRRYGGAREWARCKGISDEAVIRMESSLVVGDRQ